MRNIFDIWTYMEVYCNDCVSFWRMVSGALSMAVGFRDTTGSDANTDTDTDIGNGSKFRVELGLWLQPLKLSLALTGALLFVILKQLSSQSFARNSLWAAVAVAIVRRETTASSFLVSSQRLIGTVVGAVFAFALFEAFMCDSDATSSDADTGDAHTKCGTSVSFPIMLGWLFVCGLFRDGVHYGMASVAAGFTPLVLFLGQTQGTAEGAWLRVEMNIFGVEEYDIYMLCEVTSSIGTHSVWIETTNR